VRRGLETSLIALDLSVRRMWGNWRRGSCPWDDG